MSRDSNSLSALKASKLIKPGRYADGGGLYLQVTSPKAKSWLFRYMRAGRAREMGLGPFDIVTLAEARELARGCRKQLLDGLDPIDERRAKKAATRAASARIVTFKECAEKFIAANQAGWRSAKHADQWRATLERYAHPVLGTLPVAAIDTGLVLKVLEPIWTEKTETASRVRGRIEQILNFATVREWRTGDNPARLRGHLDNVLPKKSKVAKVRHFAAVSIDEVPDLMHAIRAKASVSARALEFTALTAARTNETIGARWSEIDLVAGVWTIPPERMKAARPHRVPLPRRALEILEAMPREGEFVFPGARQGRPLSNMAMLETMRDLRCAGATVHGLRSTFRDWAAERTAYPNHVVEMALAHIVSDKVEAAYRRGDLFEKRKRLMDDWASYCSASSGATGQIIPIMRERSNG